MLNGHIDTRNTDEQLRVIRSFEVGSYSLTKIFNVLLVSYHIKEFDDPRRNLIALQVVGFSATQLYTPHYLYFRDRAHCNHVTYCLVGCS
jgi:hypothetical protein